jgi:hypothetical protein
MLSRNGQGHGRLTFDNNSGQPAVVKLRSAEGAVIAAMFLGPGGEAAMEGLPDEPARVEFATGEVWSRACRGFAASMRAQRLMEPVASGSRLAIPPGPGVASADLPDHGFLQE